MRALYRHRRAVREGVHGLISGLLFGAAAGIVVGFALASAAGLIDPTARHAERGAAIAMKPPDVFMKNPSLAEIPFRLVPDLVGGTDRTAFPDAFCDSEYGDYVEVCSLIGEREKRVSLMLVGKRAGRAPAMSLLGDAAFMREIAKRINEAADALDRGEETIRCSLSVWGADLPAPTVQ